MRTKDYAIVVHRMQQATLKARAAQYPHSKFVLSALRDLADNLADSFKQEEGPSFKAWEFIEECGLADVKVFA